MSHDDEEKAEVEKAKNRRHAELTDAVLAEALVDEALKGRYLYVAGLDWLRWDGRRWAEVPEVQVVETARCWALTRHEEAAKAARTGQGDAEVLKRHVQVLAKSKMVALVTLAKGMPGILTSPDELDADPDLLNAANGIVDLRTGALTPHDPRRLMTKLTRGNYVAGVTHPDWTAALTALDPPERAYLQARFGQAITGRPTPDGVMPVLQGTGENGKTALSTGGVVPALGDYADTPSSKLLVAARGSEHSTEMADLRGQRLLVAEEWTEGRVLDVGMLKRIQDVGVIRARRMYRDNMSFETSHSLFVTTNYLPVVNEVDHGTWRRLALVPFRYTFRKPHEPCERPEHRPGDPQLKERIKAGHDGQHDAIVSWVVEGAIRVAKEDPDALAPTPAIEAATLAWRATADRVLGAWTDLLVADPNACVWAVELAASFNEWLLGNGHKSWPVETLTGRFADHATTRAAGVVAAQRVVQTYAVPGPSFGSPFVTDRTTQRSHWIFRLTGPGAILKPLPARPRVWLGVRWRTDQDDLAAEASVGRTPGEQQ